MHAVQLLPHQRYHQHTRGLPTRSYNAISGSTPPTPYKIDPEALPAPSPPRSVKHSSASKGATPAPAVDYPRVTSAEGALPPPCILSCRVRPPDSRARTSPFYDEAAACPVPTPSIACYVTSLASGTPVTGQDGKRMTRQSSRLSSRRSTYRGGRLLLLATVRPRPPAPGGT